MGARSPESKFFLTSMSSGQVEFFCPLCHVQQTAGVKKVISGKDHLSILALTLALTLLAWPVLKGVTLFSYMVIWAVWEFQHRTRKRDALVCRSCGFDPFLYKQDLQKARVAVRKHWEERIAQEGIYRGIKLKNYATLPAETKDKAPPSNA